MQEDWARDSENIDIIVADATSETKIQTNDNNIDIDWTEEGIICQHGKRNRIVR